MHVSAEVCGITWRRQDCANSFGSYEADQVWRFTVHGILRGLGVTFWAVRATRTTGDIAAANPLSNREASDQSAQVSSHTELFCLVPYVHPVHCYTYP